MSQNVARISALPVNERADAAASIDDPTLLTVLVFDPSHRVRVAALSNRHTPVGALRTWASEDELDWYDADDPWSGNSAGMLTPEQYDTEAAAVLSNPNVDRDVVDRVSGRGHTMTPLLRALLLNPTTTPDMLAALVSSLSPVWDDGDRATARVDEVVGQVDTTTLRRLTMSNLPLMRRWVAARPDTPAPSLLRLATDDDPSVRAAVAANPAARDEVRVAASL